MKKDRLSEVLSFSERIRNAIDYGKASFDGLGESLKEYRSLKIPGKYRDAQGETRRIIIPRYRKSRHLFYSMEPKALLISDITLELYKKNLSDEDLAKEIKLTYDSVHRNFTHIASAVSEIESEVDKMDNAIIKFYLSLINGSSLEKEKREKIINYYNILDRHVKNARDAACMVEDSSYGIKRLLDSHIHDISLKIYKNSKK